MSSASREANLPAVPEIHAPAALSALLEEILHAMGQPLTILQGCQLASMVPDPTRLLAEMQPEVERLTDLYRGLRDVVQAATVVSPRTRLPLDEVLREMAPEWQARCECREVRMELDLREGLLLDEGHLRCAAEHWFGAALESCPALGCVRIWSTHEGTGRGLCLEGGTRTETVSSQGRWRLRIAAALLEAEGGCVSYSRSPFAARVEFPSA